MDRYQLLERIGEGGMGVVWRGFDMDLEEPVAIKFLREDLASDEGLRVLFRREVKLARRVTHPNVARVYEFGRDGALHFLTMEFVEGESLASLLTHRGRLSVRQVALAAIGLCRGLAAAHAVGVVHGDIKPANVLMAARRGAVLTDFGIARVLSEVVGEETSAGTPIYMAPEQLMSSASTLQSDVYAVGVVLFEALTGGVPWQTEDMLAFLDEKCSGHAPDLGTIAPDLTGPWRELIDDCLRVEPLTRPADARALLVRLAAIEKPGVHVAARREVVPVAPRVAVEAPVWLEMAAPVGEDEAAIDTPAWPAGGGEPPTQIRGLHVVEAPEEVAPPVAPSEARSVSAPVAGRHTQAPALGSLPPRPVTRSTPLEQLRRTLARVTAATLLHEPNQTELAELYQLAEVAVAEHDDLGEAHLIMAGVLLAANEPVTAAHSAAKAIRRAPSLVAANAFVGEMLCEIGRLADGERRLDLALSLDRSSVHAWIARARLLAYRGRWDDLHAVMQGRLAELRFRSVHALRLLLWHRDSTVLTQMAEVLDENRDMLPAQLLQDSRDMVDFALARGDRRVIFERLARAYPAAGRSRHTRFFALILCEMACMLGDLERARELLRLADDLVMFEGHWLESCPTIEALRGEADFAEIRMRVRGRAAAIAEAIWG